MQETILPDNPLNYGLELIITGLAVILLMQNIYKNIPTDMTLGTKMAPMAPYSTQKKKCPRPAPRALFI